MQISPSLSSPAWMGLLNSASDWGLHFAISAVVELETVNNVRRSWEEKRNKVENLKITGFGVDEPKQAMIHGIQA